MRAERCGVGTGTTISRYNYKTLFIIIPLVFVVQVVPTTPQGSALLNNNNNNYIFDWLY